MTRSVAATGTPATLNPREDLFNSQTLGALNEEILLDVDGAATLNIDIRGTFSLTLTVQGTVDGVNWTAIPRLALNNPHYLMVITSVGNYVVNCTPFVKVRVRCTIYVSGSALVVVSSKPGLVPEIMAYGNALQVVTATGAAGAAVTLTIPAPAVGQRVYVQTLLVERHAAALLVAGATPTLVTSTNIGITLSIPVEAAAAGTVYEKVLNPARAVASVSGATPTTIVCPATTSVIWAATAYYFNAP